MSTYQLSIEPVDGATFRHNFHLGTDLRVARNVASDIYFNRKWWPRVGDVKVRSVALILNDKIVDVFDGRWASDVWAQLWEEQDWAQEKTK